MMYQKPKNVSYTQMAIYIDQNAYREDLSEDEDKLIFEYLYHLVEMLAYKAKFFSRYQYYEDFALYAASDIFIRLKNPKQFEYDNNGNPKLKKIKSILNYIKAVLYAKKVDFQQEQYDQTFEQVPLNLDCGVGYTFADSLVDSIDEIHKIDFRLCLGNVNKSIKNYIYSLPFKTDKVLTLNLYLSCLLTFISSITIKNVDIQRLQKLTSRQHQQVIFEKLLENEFTIDQVILFHLSEEYKKYVFFLTKKIKHMIAQDLSLITDDYVGSQSALKSILINDIIQKNINNEEQT